MSDRLKPCPFCGSKDIKLCGNHRDSFWFRCKECASIDSYDTEQEAKEAWNRRVAIPTQADGEYISRTKALEDVTETLCRGLPCEECPFDDGDICKVDEWLKKMPSVAIPSAEPKMGHCKDCKNFEYDSVAKVDGIPLIVAHKICNKWGDGCKTSEDGYCFLYEPQESEDKE